MNITLATGTKLEMRYFNSTFQGYLAINTVKT